MIGKLNIKINVSSDINGKRVANLIQNLIDNVSEKDLLSLELEVQKNSGFFKKIVKVLPMIKKFIK